MSIIKNNIIVEYNDKGNLIHSESFPGAYTRGKEREEALAKFPSEVKRYCKWAGIFYSETDLIESIVVESKKSEFQINDADSDVIFLSEQTPYSAPHEYETTKIRVLKSAHDFQVLYDSIPDKEYTILRERKSFYGTIPRTATEMYDHTNSVTNYYAREIGVRIDNLANIYQNRIQAIKAIESVDNYLENKILKGSYGEQWSLKKVLRRFIWHDHIHAKAMYRMAAKIWGVNKVENPFYFI